MEALIWIVTAAAVFGLCRLVDKGFQKLFRNKAEHLSGQAVRVNKRYGVFGVILSALGVAAIATGKIRFPWYSTPSISQIKPFLAPKSIFIFIAPFKLSFGNRIPPPCKARWSVQVKQM